MRSTSNLRSARNQIENPGPRQSTSALRARNFNEVMKNNPSSSKIVPINKKPALPPKPATSHLKSRNNQNDPSTAYLKFNQLNPNTTKNELFECDRCGKPCNKKNMFRTPKCSDHYYCDMCVRHPSQSNLSDLCQKCLVYFNFIGKIVEKGQYRCGLCPMPPVYSALNCKVHEYCNECKKFVEENEFMHIVNLVKCRDCVRNAEMLKKKIMDCSEDIESEGKVNEIKTNEHSKRPISASKAEPFVDNSLKVANIFKDQNLNPVSNFSRSKIQNFEKNKNPLLINLEDNTEPDKFELLNPKAQENFEKAPATAYCDACETTKNNEELLKIPKCLYHSYCKNCINHSKFAKNCSYCPGYFNYIGNVSIISQNRCNLCSNRPTPNDLNCTVHQYCNECKEFIEGNKYKHIANLMRCNDCKKNAKALKKRKEEKMNEFILSLSPESPHKKVRRTITRENLVLDFENPQNEERDYINLQPISTRSSLIFEVRCSNCRKNQDISGFLCNHNSCIFCLVSTCLKEIFEFFKQYQVDPNKIKDKFTYKCPIKDCEKEISVPTLLIIKNHEKFMKDSEYYSNNKIYDFVKLDLLIPWIPYFDGLSAWSAF